MPCAIASTCKYLVYNRRAVRVHLECSSSWYNRATCTNTIYLMNLGLISNWERSTEMYIASAFVTRRFPNTATAVVLESSSHTLSLPTVLTVQQSLGSAYYRNRYRYIRTTVEFPHQKIFDTAVTYTRYTSLRAPDAYRVAVQRASAVSTERSMFRCFTSAAQWPMTVLPYTAVPGDTYGNIYWYDNTPPWDEFPKFRAQVPKSKRGTYESN